jgi:hypothetical protein
MFGWENRFLCQILRYQLQYNVHEYRHCTLSVSVLYHCLHTIHYHQYLVNKVHELNRCIVLQRVRQGKGRVGAAGGMPASPLPPTPTLPYTVLFTCEHFDNFVRELLVNFASGLFSILVCKVFLCVHNACAYSMLSCSIVHTHHFQMFYTYYPSHLQNY